jgi:hypothetical protein
MVRKVDNFNMESKSEKQVSALNLKRETVQEKNDAEHRGNAKQTKSSRTFGFSFNKRSSEPVLDFGNCTSESHIRNAQNLGRFLKEMGDEIYNRYLEDNLQRMDPSLKENTVCIYIL